MCVESERDVGNVILCWSHTCDRLRMRVSTSDPAQREWVLWPPPRGQIQLTAICVNYPETEIHFSSTIIFAQIRPLENSPLVWIDHETEGGRGLRQILFETCSINHLWVP